MKRFFLVSEHVRNPLANIDAYARRWGFVGNRFVIRENALFENVFWIIYRRSLRVKLVDGS